jgi:hypothetical protein
MNEPAPVHGIDPADVRLDRHHQAGRLGDLEDFREACEAHAWFFQEGWISLHVAVDNLQRLAERWGLVDEIGQDEVQRVIAYVSVAEPPQPSEYEVNYVARIITQWEAADGKRAAPTPIRPEPRRGVPKATVDAFKYVVSTGDPEYLARWLREHSDVARALASEVA